MRANEQIPAITYFRAKGTIIGPGGSTAVFGMGTGVTLLVRSPENHMQALCTPACARRQVLEPGIGSRTSGLTSSFLNLR